MQRLVVGIARLLDNSLETDVSAHLIARLVQQEQSQEASDAAVAVAERVDAEEIEDVRTDDHERIYLWQQQGTGKPTVELIDRGGR